MLKKVFVGYFFFITFFASNSQVLYTGEIAVKFKKRPDFISGQVKKNKKLSYQPVHKQSLSKENSVLSNIYIIKAENVSDIEVIIDSLRKLNEVIYAEPVYREQLLEIPDDPEAQPGAEQDYLEIIKAYEAWEVSKSTSEIIIGIIDTGADLDHEDLQSKLYQNDDPVNGVDDDGNGFVDDIYGYDFANVDADVSADGNQHGTHVSGIATAETNNGLGIASVGYHASLSPIKIFTTEANMSNGSYEGVLYAADNGYDIINLSWGSIDTYSQFNQDIINYAVLEKDVVVVAAAGNTPSDVAFYPASYENVLSVSSTNSNDTKASFATYHRKVDLVAPGVSVFSTQNNDTYGSDNGSSHSAPQVAGVAALVKHQFPELSAIQIMERIRTTADDIYQISENEIYLGKLGKGRLNALRAVSEQNVISIRALEPQITGTNGTNYYPGDTLNISFRIVNYLDPAIDPEFTLTSTDGQLDLLTATQFSGFIQEGDTIMLKPFSVVLDESLQPVTTIEFGLKIKDRNKYSDFQVFEFTTASNFVTLSGDSLTIPVNGNGYITQDLRWKEQMIMEYSGNLLRVDSGSITDNLPDTWYPSPRTSDFISVTALQPSAIRLQASNILKDTAGQINIEQDVHIFDKKDNVFATSYTLVNLLPDTLRNVEFALFLDFDLGDELNNDIYLDSSHIAITSLDEQLFAGIKPVTEDSVRFYFMDLGALEDTVNELSDSLFSEWLTKPAIDSLGFSEPVDAGSFITVKIDSLAPYERRTVHFVWGASDNKQSLIAQLDSAVKDLDTLQRNPLIREVFYSCEGATVEIDPSKGENFVFYSDPLGKNVIDTASSISVGPLTSDSLVYASSLDSIYPGKIHAYLVNTLNEIAKFRPTSDTLFLGDDPNNQLSFIDESIDPVEWSWDFGNGIQAVGIANPSVSYNSPGSYSVTLIVNNIQGCVDTVQKQIDVIERPSMPDLPDEYILCPGSSIAFETSENDTLNLYLTANSKFPAISNTLIQLDYFENDSAFFLSRLQNGIESHRREVKINFQEINSSVNYSAAIDSSAIDLIWIFPEDTSHSISRWLVNGIEFLNQDTLAHTVTDTVSVFMEGTNIAGCTFTDSTYLIFTKSPDVEIEIPEFCAGDSIILSTSPKRLLGFYSDENLTHLIRKSEELLVKNINGDTSFHIVAIDSLIPSDTLSVTLSPQDFEYSIIASPDSLFLTDDFGVDFSISEPAATINWYIDSIFQTSSINPTLFFNNSGEYMITSLAFTSVGCSFLNQIIYKVYNERPLEAGNTSELIIYPNPADKYLIISSNENIQNAVIYDPSGKSVLNFEIIANRIDVSSLKTGLYILELTSREKVYLQKIYIK